LAAKLLDFTAGTQRSWAQQVSSLRYSNRIVNESFKFYNFYDHKCTTLIAFTTKLKKNHEIMLNTFCQSLII